MKVDQKNTIAIKDTQGDFILFDESNAPIDFRKA
jgi:hypothetical protein